LTGRAGGQTFTGGGNQSYANQGAQPANTNTGNQGAQVSNTGNQPVNTPMPNGRVEPPSAHYQNINAGVFSVNVPDNWKEIEGQNGVWFAPAGAYGSTNGQTVFTHAVSLGVAQTQARDPQQAADEFIKSLTQGGGMRPRGGYERMDVDGRQGRLISFDGSNEATGRPELVHILTTQLKNGELFYMIAVSPTDEYKNYQTTFLTILRSIKLND
jgi:hypothetical protein